MMDNPIFNPMRKKVRGGADTVCDSVAAQSRKDDEGKLRRVGDVVRVISDRNGRTLAERAVITGFRQATDGAWWFAFTEVRDSGPMLSSSTGAYPFSMVSLR